MSDKKHIDRVFQEHFKDFEAIPNPRVWKTIEAELNKKKKQRIIPIWWRYAGVAALFFLLLTVGRLVYIDSNNIPENQVVETEETDIKKLNKKESIVPFNIDNEEEIISKKEAVVNLNTDKENPVNKTKKTNYNSQHKTSITKKIVVTSTSPLKQKFKAVLSQKTIITSALKIDSNTIIAKHNLKNDNKKGLKESGTGKSRATDIVENLEETPSVQQIAKNTKTIEETIEETKLVKESPKKNINRWRITPNAAPVYFNSLDEKGSSIDPQLNDNAKNGELNMSYGIQASYAVNNKWSIRAGINRVNLGYDTEDVLVFQSATTKSSSLQNVKSNTKGDNSVSVISYGNLKSAKSSENFIETSRTSISQNMGYIEVPLEVQYALTNNKLGITVIGGFSSLFLNKNEIFSEIEGPQNFSGQANNINKISYSANLGLGLNYKFSKKIDLNVEPIFKYQINTFNNASGNFKPYFVGVYTGFAIKF